mmetsp:Transcript_142855/g.397954  ORF Transcript_142855/g.397954 Transcript_142855/m.397954 type:complete len:322 (-) Transcript_142855:408-1373(-)
MVASEGVTPAPRLLRLRVAQVGAAPGAAAWEGDPELRGNRVVVAGVLQLAEGTVLEKLRFGTAIGLEHHPVTPRRRFERAEIVHARSVLEGRRELHEALAELGEAGEATLQQLVVLQQPLPGPHASELLCLGFQLRVEVSKDGHEVVMHGALVQRGPQAAAAGRRALEGLGHDPLEVPIPLGRLTLACGQVHVHEACRKPAYNEAHADPALAADEAPEASLDPRTADLPHVGRKLRTGVHQGGQARHSEATDPDECGFCARDRALHAPLESGQALWVAALLAEDCGSSRLDQPLDPHGEDVRAGPFPQPPRDVVGLSDLAA